MENIYRIPLKFSTGKYSLPELVSADRDFLEMNLDKYGILTYRVPKYGTEVRIYSVEPKILKNTMKAQYDDSGNLEYADFKRNNRRELIYIRLDEESAKMTIYQFARFQADMISEKIIHRREKMSRIFVEYFYDGSVDFAIKPCSVEDFRQLAKSCGNCMDSLDSSGEYPHENRIECDRDTLSVMLLCVPDSLSTELFYFAVYVMTEKIKENILDRIEKTDDFKFIAEEYD
ncbi:MAG: hypothetical protein K2I82_03935 [Ruminococcus sp.]|nr:hypothetical protein [Ruminococcus sp.]